MPEKIKEVSILEARYGPRFHHLPDDWTRGYVADFRLASPDKPDSLVSFWGAAKQLGGLTMRSALNTQLPNSGDGTLPMLAVCVPRGAYAMAEGVLERHPLPLVVTNDGGIRDHSLPLVPVGVPQLRVQNMFIIDPVIDTGTTLKRTVEALDNHGVTADFVTALAIIAHPPTVEQLLNQYPRLSIITADTESETVPAKDGSGGRWLAGFGDIGGNVAAAVAKGFGSFYYTPGYYVPGN